MRTRRETATPSSVEVGWACPWGEALALLLVVAAALLLGPAGLPRFLLAVSDATHDVLQPASP